MRIWMLKPGAEIGKPMPVEQIEIERFLPGLASFVQRAIEKHGGRLVWRYNTLTVYFPSGTTKRLIWPVTMECRFKIHFPDGYEILEVETRDGRHALGFDPSIFPEHMRARYPAVFGNEKAPEDGDFRSFKA